MGISRQSHKWLFSGVLVTPIYICVLHNSVALATLRYFLGANASASLTIVPAWATMYGIMLAQVWLLIAGCCESQAARNFFPIQRGVQQHLLLEILDVREAMPE